MLKHRDGKGDLCKLICNSSISSGESGWGSEMVERSRRRNGRVDELPEGLDSSEWGLRLWEEREGEEIIRETRKAGHLIGWDNLDIYTIMY